jgi:hypothetical protein
VISLILYERAISSSRIYFCLGGITILEKYPSDRTSLTGLSNVVTFERVLAMVAVAGDPFLKMIDEG